MKDSFSRRSKALLAGVAAAALLAAAPAAAGGYPADEPLAPPASDGWLRAAPPAAFPAGRVRPVWTFETGTRLWFSSGSYAFDLFAPGGGGRLSRLDFGGLDAQSAEVFGRFDFGSGFFLKGTLGGGSISGGSLSDQDFPPAVTPTSDTRSEVRHGDLRYLTFDAGYDVWRGGPFRVGGFVGYGYWGERVNTFGCAQTAGGPVCTGSGIAGSVDALDGEPHWNMLRVGAAAGWEFVPGFRLDVDAAYVRGYLGGADFHNLRPDIRNAPISGSGNGFMIDTILSWQATEALSFGAGARWWRMESEGEFHFEDTLAGNAGAVAQPIKTEQDRYGLLLQANYRLGVDPSAAPDRFSGQAIGPTWTGPYVGLGAGYGFGNGTTAISGLTPQAAADLAAGAVPRDLSSRRSGLLGGATVGFGWQIGRMVYGVEADASYADIGGSTGRTDPVTGTVTTVETEVSWLATVRGRIGRALTQDVVAFMSGGAAFGGVHAKADVRDASTAPCAAMFVCSSGASSKTAVGWTVGAGFEVAINGWASVKTEYLHVDLGRVGVTTTDAGAGGPSDYSANPKVGTDLIRSGLNVRF